MARVLGDYVLDQHTCGKLVLFSLATQLRKHQSEYYEQLCRAQQGTLDCTTWVRWYLGKILSTQKWAELMHCSHDTAMRDIKDLIHKGVLKQSERGGRSTSYVLVLPQSLQ